MIALIPARAGSKRVPNKNTRPLAGYPLIAYTIAAAQQSGIFDDICICSDAPLDRMAVPVLSWVQRPPSADDEPDIAWIRYVLAHRAAPRPDNFAILRATSPFRTAETIRRAYQQFRDMADCGDSIRAVEPVKQHPGKMWSWDGPGMPIVPLLGYKRSDGVPWHSCPTQSLPTFYVQNSSLEMSWTANVEVHGTIHGRKVGPFFTQGYEGFSIDYPEDWIKAEQIAQDHPELLPAVTAHV